MIKEIFATVWILAAIAVVILGLNGSIAPAAMVSFSLVALGLFYAFALLTVMVNTRDPVPQRANK